VLLPPQRKRNGKIISIFEFTLPIEPVPASRPRVTKWGVYYGKNHRRFQKEAKKVLAELDIGKPIEGPISVHCAFYCKRPKTTKRYTPRGDTDNYLKIVLDECSGWLWVDDDQIVKLSGRKEFEDADGPRIVITIFAP